VVETTSAYITIRNWFTWDQVVGIMITVRQASPRIADGETVEMVGVLVEFVGLPLVGAAPLNVQFTDLTTYTDTLAPDSWHWDFGDGADSADQNPSHSYAAGTYTVTLTVTFADGSSKSITKVAYVTAT
jgi:PKD repeat protein